jgi:hypothetical protein
MDEKQPRGRPTVNKIEQIPASPEDIAKAIFRAAEKNVKPAKPKTPRKPS